MRQPELDVDLYCDEAIANPYPLYRQIRDLGPAVWLSRHEAWAIARYADVRAALRADDALVSGQGVAMNELVNSNVSRVTLTTDGELHRQLRFELVKPMMPSALKSVQPLVQKLADELVDGLVARDSFDGIADFARHLPLSVVSHLVGLPEEGRQRMLAWAAATFDALGVMNERMQNSLPAVVEFTSYVAQLERDQLRPDGWAARLFDAAGAGRIDRGDIVGMLIDYVAPSLDTTILGSGHMLFELGRNPAQWEMLRKDASLIPRAIDEALRLEAPVRAFSRVAVRDYAVDGTKIPAGDRVLVIYGSGNRDERHYADPDRYDLTREARDHLGFGHGVHRCAGSHLAELEMSALLRAMLPRVEKIEVSDPELAPNNVLRGYRSFRVSFR